MCVYYTFHVYVVCVCVTLIVLNVFNIMYAILLYT